MNATKHNHDALPFGRKQPVGCCPRCDELHAGVPARSGWRNQADKAASLAIRNHDCKASGGSSVCCTFGDF